ncbi:MAG: hypothetical protein WA705_25570 [Candidatus Ozemobacteraceae bacterium]
MSPDHSTPLQTHADPCTRKTCAIPGTFPRSGGLRRGYTRKYPLEFSAATALFAFLLALGFCLSTLGCGGGGSSGGAVGADTTPLAPLMNMAVPTNGYQTSGFPASGTSLSVKNFSNTQTSELMLLNRNASPMTVNLSAQLSDSSASVRSLHSNAIAKSDADLSDSTLSDRLDRSARSARIYSQLRDLEKLQPLFSSGTSSGASAKSSKRADSVGDATSFRVLLGADLSQLGSVNAICRSVTPLGATSGNLNIYLDSTLSYTTAARNFISALAQVWPTDYAKMRTIFGEEPPANFNNLGTDITVVLTPAVEIAGFFNSGDLFPPDQVVGGKSNQKKIFYLQYAPDNPTVRSTFADAASTMVHEFQHMINFYQRNSRGLQEEDWLNEAMSGYAEHVCGYSMTTTNVSKAIQVQRFFLKTEQVDLTPSPWPGVLDHEHYGQVYLFGTWLGEKYGVAGSVRSLINSSKVGKEGITAMTGKSFDVIAAEWMLALVINDQTVGAKYGYPDINLYKSYTYDATITGTEEPLTINLSGPERVSNGASFPFSRSISIAPWTSAFVSLNGGNGTNLRLSLPSRIDTFEMHK